MTDEGWGHILLASSGGPLQSAQAGRAATSAGSRPLSLEMRRTGPRALCRTMWLFGAGLGLGAPGAGAFGLPPCAAAPGGCTLREAADFAGVFVGAAVNPGDFAPGAPLAALVPREFSSVTPENALKWAPLAPAPGSEDFAQADAFVDGAAAAGLRVRGHTLVWGRLNGPPAWLPAQIAAAPDPAAALRALVDDHVASVVGRYAGRIESWDVVNEPLDIFGSGLASDSLFQRVLGESYIGDAFRAARAADPSARLFLNEFWYGFDTGKFDALVGLLGRLLADGVPIDGIGFQGHYSLYAPDLPQLQSQLATLSGLGLDVEITELDIPLRLFAGDPDPLAAQGRAFAGVYAACLATPRCTGVTTWGVSDADSWLDSAEIFSLFAPNRPLLFDESLEPKPAYGAVRDALLAVPEPASGPALAAGLVALAARARLRRGVRRGRWE